MSVMFLSSRSLLPSITPSCCWYSSSYISLVSVLPILVRFLFYWHLVLYFCYGTFSQNLGFTSSIQRFNWDHTTLVFPLLQPWTGIDLTIHLPFLSHQLRSCPKQSSYHSLIEDHSSLSLIKQELFVLRLNLRVGKMSPNKVRVHFCSLSNIFVS